jgi:uncharacterized membrane protein SpoIIM required for sporulation
MSDQTSSQSADWPSIFEDGWEKTAAEVFIVEVVLLFILSAVPLPSSISSVLLSQYQYLKGGIYAQGFLAAAITIFLHNFLNATLELLPLIGTLWFLVSTSITSITVSAIGPSLGASGPLIVFSLFLSPHTWLELPAYALAATEGIYLFIAMFGMGSVGTRAESRRFVMVWAIVAVELLVAATFESSEISLEGISPLYYFLTWIPFFIILIAVIIVRRREKEKLRMRSVVTPMPQPTKAVPVELRVAPHPGSRRRSARKKTSRILKKRKTNRRK